MKGVLLVLRVILCCPSGDSKISLVATGLFAVLLLAECCYLVWAKARDLSRMENTFLLSLVLRGVKHATLLAIIWDLRTNRHRIDSANRSLEALEVSLGVKKKRRRSNLALIGYPVLCHFFFGNTSLLYSALFAYFHLAPVLVCLLFESYATCARQIVDRISLLSDDREMAYLEFEDAMRFLERYKTLYAGIRQVNESFGSSTFFVLLRINLCLALGIYYSYIIYGMIQDRASRDKHGYDFLFELLFVPVYVSVLTRLTSATFHLSLSLKKLKLRVFQSRQLARDPRTQQILGNLELFMLKHVVALKFKGDQTSMSKGLWFGLLHTIQKTALLLKDLRDKGF